jgi:hypothetical protein
MANTGVGIPRLTPLTFRQMRALKAVHERTVLSGRERPNGARRALPLRRPLHSDL